MVVFVHLTTTTKISVITGTQKKRNFFMFIKMDKYIKHNAVITLSSL